MLPAVFCLLSSQALFAQSPQPGSSPAASPSASGSAPAIDEANGSTLPEVVVTETAIRTGEVVLDVPQSVTILGQDTILRSQQETPNEMLRGQPGIWSVNVPAQGSPIVRGEIGNHVLYLWNGIRINNGDLYPGPNGYFNEFPVGSIDRMEVVHGSGSVEYGSDAIGGVINIIPKQGTFTDRLLIGGDISARYNSNDNEDTQTYDLFLSDKNFSLMGGFTYQDVGNYHGAGVGELKHTGFQALGGYVDFAYKVADNQTFRIDWFQDNRNNVGYYGQSRINPDGIPTIEDPYEQRGTLKIDYTITDLAPWSSEMNFYGYYQYFNAERDRNVDAFPVDFTSTATVTRQNILGFGAQNTTTAGDFKFIYGLDYRAEELGSTERQSYRDMETDYEYSLVPDGKTPDGFYGVFDTFLETQYKPIESLQLSAGVRFEDTSLNSHPTEADVIPGAGYTLDELKVDKTWQSVTWDAGAIYNLTHNWDLVADINSAFRTPNFADLFSEGPAVYSSKTASVPSPNLDPEQSITYEAGPRFHTSQFNGSLTGYYTQLHDLITTVYSGNVTIPGQGTFTASHNANAESGYIAGVELAASYRPFRDWTFYGNATYTYGDDTTDDVPLRFIPPLNGTIGIRYDDPSGRWWVELEENLVATFYRPAPGDMLDSGFSQDPGYGSPNTTNNPPFRSDFHIPGYALTFLRGGYTVWQNKGRSLSLTLDLDNLFNTHYREVYAQQELAGPGFGAVIGARLTF